jgi:hypothetical protein
MKNRVQVVRRVPRRVPIAEAYIVPEAERVLNVGLIHAAPSIDVHAIKEGAYERYIERTRKRGGG